MKLSTNWLKEYTDIDIPLEDLAPKLTMAGLEVEGVISLSKEDIASAGGSGTKDDIVWDVKVTPNRGDWLSMIGVAREVAPLVGGKLQMPQIDIEYSDPPSSDLINIRIDDPDLCRRYVGIVIRNVKIQESPDWMKDRLVAAGMRPINNVVDITNYVMLELGQPLHAFDYKLLTNSQIIVRRAKPSETITSIDGVERKLEPDMLVIADSLHSVAIAGVMGGEFSEISEHTQDILIESANFNSTSIRRTAKCLNMVTESSYRFEREVDPGITVTAALRAAQLIQQLGDGNVAKGVVDVYPSPIEPIEVEVRTARVNAVLGTSIDPEEMVKYLNSYFIETTLNKTVLNCKVPTFRRDITREIDLVEEIGRGLGYDTLPMTLPRSSLQGKDSPEGVFADKLRQVISSCGGQEVLTHSLVDSKLAAIAGLSDQRVIMRNPLSEELDSMRVMLMPNLIQVLARNQAFGTPSLSVFEIGKVYYSKDGEIDEKLSVSGAMVGDQWKSAWNLPKEALETDFFLCKGIVESIIDRLGINGARFVNTEHPMLHPTRAAKILIGGREVGVIGEVSNQACEMLDVRGRPCAFELDFGALMDSTPGIPTYKPLPRYPALFRHLAVVVADEVKYEDLENIILDCGKELVEKVELLEIYKGEPINASQRSITISMVFRSREKTLTDVEVNAKLAEIREVLNRRVQATFR